MSLNTTELLQAVGLGAAGVAGIYRWMLTRFRSELKDDLRILKDYTDMFDKDDPHALALRRAIQNRMRRAYERPAVERRALVLGLFSLVFGAFNFVAERPPSLMAVIVGFLGVTLGVASVVAAIVAPRDV